MCRSAPLMLSIILCTLPACGLFPTLTPGDVRSPAGTTTTFILIRHAERDPGLDPPLNAEGLARAQTLKTVLEENGVTAIYATDYLRNRQTVEPTATLLDITPTYYNLALFVDTPALATLFIQEALRDHKGGTILYCGNRGTQLGMPGITETIYEQLGGQGEGPNRYQDMYIVVVPDEGDVRFVKTVYGPVSSLD